MDKNAAAKNVFIIYPKLKPFIILPSSTAATKRNTIAIKISLLRFVYLCSNFLMYIIYNHNNKLYLHDYNKVLQYCKKLLEINHWFLINWIFKIIWNILIIAYFLTISRISYSGDKFVSQFKARWFKSTWSYENRVSKHFVIFSTSSVW